jgi:predicted HTH transcriptional regulator
MFFDAVRNHALAINAGFNPPLPHSEVRATAKSVSKWTWRHMSTEGFRERQTRLSKMAASKRTHKKNQLRDEVLKTVEQCPSLTREDVGIMFGISRYTVQRYLREARLSDMGVDTPEAYNG